jgi:hypothetical protein
MQQPLTDDDVIEIWQSTDTQKEIADRFKISQGMVTLIKNRKIKTNVTENLGPPGRSDSPQSRRTLTKSDALEIYLSIEESEKALGDKYGVNRSVVGKIRRGEVWKAATYHIRKQNRHV